jgi:6-phosphogluconolactonase
MIDIHTTRIQSVNERFNIIIPGDYLSTINYAVNHFIETANHYIQKNSFFSVALSGGSTPKAIFKILSSSKFKNKVEWDKILFFWSDERAVPPDSLDSNYKMAMDSGFKDLPIKKENIFRMEAEKNIQQKALDYEMTLLSKLSSKPLDMVMLGIGDDGHTASLFPGTKALQITDRKVVENYLPEKKTWRMTFTLTHINQAKNIVVYVLGEKKQTILKKILFPEPMSETYPSQLIGSKKNKALLIVDILAASKLKKAK